MDVDFDFDAALSNAAKNENSITNFLSVEDYSQSSDEFEETENDKKELNVSSNCMNKYLDYDPNLIYTRENWPNICDAITSNPANAIRVNNIFFF